MTRAQTANSDWIVRPAALRDLESLLGLALVVGPGMTTMPQDREAMSRKLEISAESFAGNTAGEAQFILVLEDVDGTVSGIAAVYPRVGEGHGFFSYKLTRLVQRSALLGRRTEAELLTLNNDYTGATEVGSLAIAPTLRGTGAAQMLARARYMLVAAFPNLFAATVMAEMRGWQDENGRSPFWDAIGAHFFDLPFDEADRLSAVEGVGFIAELMPKHPIYTALLPKEARAVIGKPHRHSARAMAMLEEEGFRYDGHVDVFDGGPQIHVARDHIRTVARNAAGRVGVPAANQHTSAKLVSNCVLQNFRVFQTQTDLTDGIAGLSDKARRALDLVEGDAVRVAPPARAAGEATGINQ